MNARSNPKWKAGLKRGLLALAIWTAVGCIFALPNLTGSGGWFYPLLSSLAQWWAWGLLAPAIVNVDLRLPFTHKQMVSRIAAHLLLCPIFTAIYIYLFGAVLSVMRMAPWSRLANIHLLLNALRGMFLWSALVYCLIVGLWHAYQYYRRYLLGELRMERLERSFSEARLNALRMQLDPHFLFNALNTISSQVEREPRLARKMIEHLGDLLRMSLENKDRQEVPLAEELAFLDHYLAIQQIRFGDRLTFVMEIDANVKLALVPCLVIQPLVENAIRHGLSMRASGGSVAVTAWSDGERLEIVVADDGVGLPKGWTMENSAGVGLSVTRERIRGMHPDGAASLALRPRRRDGVLSGGTEAVISLPLRVSGRSRKEVPRAAIAG